MDPKGKSSKGGTDAAKASQSDIDKRAAELDARAAQIEVREKAQSERGVELSEKAEALAKRALELDEREKAVLMQEAALKQEAERIGGDLAEKAALKPGSVRVTSKVNGFRRAGLEHAGTRVFKPGELNDWQIEALRAESDSPNGRLVVELY